MKAWPTREVVQILTAALHEHKITPRQALEALEKMVEMARTTARKVVLLCGPGHVAAAIKATLFAKTCPLVFHAVDNIDIEALRDFAPDIGILAWWPHIIKEPLLSLPKLGWLNTHPSLLPYGRGKHPNFWAIEDDTPYGATLHWVTGEVDAGPIAWQREIPYGWTATGGSLYALAQTAMVELFEDHVDDILAGEIPRRMQDWDATTHGYAARARSLEVCSKIDIDDDGWPGDGGILPRETLNTIRARTFTGHPGAWFTDDGVKYRVRVEITRDNDE